MQEFFKLTADNEIPVSAVNSKYSQVIFCKPAHLFDPDVEVLGCFIDGEHIFFVYRNFLIGHDSCLLSLSFYQYSPSWRLFFRSETKKDLQILRKEPAGLLPLYYTSPSFSALSWSCSSTIFSLSGIGSPRCPAFSRRDTPSLER